LGCGPEPTKHLPGFPASVQKTTFFPKSFLPFSPVSPVLIPFKGNKWAIAFQRKPVFPGPKNGFRRKEVDFFVKKC